MDINAVKSTYARWAPIYDKTFGVATNVGRRRAVSYINAQNGTKVLEVGVGTGLALPLYRPDLQVTGVDYSQDMLEMARRKVQELNLEHIQGLHQMDARTLGFDDDSFDIVSAMHVLSVVPDPQQVLAEIVRVCKPGGKVVITNHFAQDQGGLAFVERVAAPFSNLLGWHSDFEIETILDAPGLTLKEKKPLPPFKMMTFLALEKNL